MSLLITLKKKNESTKKSRMYFQNNPYYRQIPQPNCRNDMIESGCGYDTIKQQSFKLYENPGPLPTTNRGQIMPGQLQKINPRLMYSQGGVNLNRPETRKTEVANFQQIQTANDPYLQAQMVEANARQRLQENFYNNQDGYVRNKMPEVPAALPDRILPCMKETQILNHSNVVTGIENQHSNELRPEMSYKMKTQAPQQLRVAYPTNLFNGVEAVSIAPVTTEMNTPNRADYEHKFIVLTDQTMTKQKQELSKPELSNRPDNEPQVTRNADGSSIFAPETSKAARAQNIKMLTKKYEAQILRNNAIDNNLPQGSEEQRKLKILRSGKKNVHNLVAPGITSVQQNEERITKPTLRRTLKQHTPATKISTQVSGLQSSSKVLPTNINLTEDTTSFNIAAAPNELHDAGAGQRDQSHEERRIFKERHTISASADNMFSAPTATNSTMKLSENRGLNMNIINTGVQESLDRIVPQYSCNAKLAEANISRPGLPHMRNPKADSLNIGKSDQKNMNKKDQNCHAYEVEM